MTVRPDTGLSRSDAITLALVLICCGGVTLLAGWWVWKVLG